MIWAEILKTTRRNPAVTDAVIFRRLLEVRADKQCEEIIKPN